ncbi:MAG TPA: dihydroxyacetone kinase subunit DhaK [Acetobacteraceae bacterium]|jgi:dihydroxyacetone kinase-like protein
MGVALTSCIVPAAGSPTFVLEEDESETGAGIHGEPGRRRLKLKTADAIAEEMLAVILGDLASARGAICLLLVNGFGGTSAMEFYLMVNAIRRILAHRVQAARYPVGSYVTSLDGEVFLTVTLIDSILEQYWDAPAHGRASLAAGNGPPPKHSSRAKTQFAAESSVRWRISGG